MLKIAQFVEKIEKKFQNNFVHKLYRYSSNSNPEPEKPELEPEPEKHEHDRTDFRNYPKIPEPESAKPDPARLLKLESITNSYLPIVLILEAAADLENESDVFVMAEANAETEAETPSSI